MRGETDENLKYQNTRLDPEDDPRIGVDLGKGGGGEKGSLG
jgi:hypothetical protein